MSQDLTDCSFGGRILPPEKKKMTTETKVNSMIFSGARDAVSEVLRDSAVLLRNAKVDLPKLGITNQSVDIEYNDEYFVEVSMKLIKKL